jgi:hypothetical protein
MRLRCAAGLFATRSPNAIIVDGDTRPIVAVENHVVLRGATVFLLPMDPVAADHIPDDCFQRDGLPIR